MLSYPPPPNDNQYLYDLNIEFDKDWCLRYYDHVKDTEESYIDERPNSLDHNWKIARISEFSYADDIMEQLGLLDIVKDYRVRFYKLKANAILGPHIDLNTQCSLNFVLSESAAPVTFDLDKHFTYKYALFNTSRRHGVVNGPEDRLLFKISIMDRSFEEIKKIISAKFPVSFYTVLNSDPQYELLRTKRASRPKIDADAYNKIHTKNLIPLPITIDCDLFETEIQQFQDRFEQFGITHTEIERYSLGLTKSDPDFDCKPTPINWPMDIWSLNHPEAPLDDIDFHIPTDAMTSMQSMRPFTDIFEQHLARCCILKWNNGAHFKPHLDVGIPCANLRLWGTNDPANNHFCFWNRETQQYEEEVGIERGRLYLADTSKYHHAYATADSVYTFFFALQVTSYDTIARFVRPQTS